MVAVEALIDGVVVASTEGSITEGEISVSIDECGEGNMTWRVRSIDADPYSVASQTWTFAEEGPVLEASAASWASLEGFSAELPTDPVGATLDANARAVWPHPATGDSRLWADGHRAVRLARGRDGEGGVHPRRWTPLRLQR